MSNQGSVHFEKINERMSDAYVQNHQPIRVKEAADLSRILMCLSFQHIDGCNSSEINFHTLNK